MALTWGLSDYQFWYEEPDLLFAYAKSYEMKQRQWQVKTNFEAWLNGAYITNAVASVLSKNSKYPDKPFDILENDNPEDLKIKNEELIRKQSKKISELLSKKASRKL